MVFTRFVEIGRIVLINRGPDKGKLAAIVDIIDYGRVLVDGPTTGVRRGALNFKSLLLTDFKINISVSARTTQVKKAMEDAEIEKKWSETKWAKGLASRQKRASLTDFERFVVRVNKTKKAQIIRKALKDMKPKAAAAKK